jgi:hypothetical protein
VVLVQAYPRGEGKVGTQAHKHPAPALVVEVEVVLVDPTLLELQVRAVVLLSPDGQQDAGRLPRFEDDGNSIGWAAPKILLNKIISPLFLGHFHDGSAPFLGSVLHPVLELIGDLRQHLPGHPFPFAVGIEKPQHSLWLLEGLDQAVEQDSIEASILELDVILVMLVKGVHGLLHGVEIPERINHGRLNAHRSAVVLHRQLTTED